MKLPHPTEHQEQARLITWWRYYCLSKDIDERLLFSVPNGSNKSMQQAIKFKREGLRKGVPDLFLAHPRYGMHGLWIELKRIGGKAREEQSAYIELLSREGYAACVCAGADAAIKCIEGYLAVQKPGLVALEL